MELIFVSLRRSGMKSNLFGQSPAPRPVRAGLAVVLLVPLLAACGSAAAGSGSGSGSGSGASDGAETPGPAPSAPVPYCGLSSEGGAQRTENGMTFPATTDFLGKSLDDAKALAASRKLALRVVGQDGECGMVTDDFSAQRVNVYLEGGSVIGVGAF